MDMTTTSFTSTQPESYHYHWLAFWRPLAAVVLLAMLSIGGSWVWLPLGLGFLALALIGAMSLYLHWSWHTFTFTADNRLIRRRGFLGCTEDVISLFGIVTPYQIPVLGRCLDIGNVHLRVAGSSLHVRHIAHFQAFCGQLTHSIRRQEERPAPTSIYFIVPAPFMEYGRRGSWLDRLPPGGT